MQEKVIPFKKTLRYQSHRVGLITAKTDQSYQLWLEDEKSYINATLAPMCLHQPKLDDMVLLVDCRYAYFIVGILTTNHPLQLALEAEQVKVTAKQFHLEAETIAEVAQTVLTHAEEWVQVIDDIKCQTQKFAIN